MIIMIISVGIIAAGLYGQAHNTIKNLATCCQKVKFTLNHNTVFSAYGSGDTVAGGRFSLEAFGGQLYIDQPILRLGLTSLPPSLCYGGGQFTFHISNSSLAVFVSGKYSYTKNLGSFNFEWPQPELKFSGLSFSSGVGYEHKLVGDLAYSLGPAINGFYTSFFYRDTSANPSATDTTMHNFYLYPVINLGLRLRVFSLLFIKFQAEVGYVKVFRWGSPYSDITEWANDYIVPDLRLGLGCFVK